MSLLNENVSKELQRMAKLAGIATNIVSESLSNTANTKEKVVNKILKEEQEEDDILGSIGDILGSEQSLLQTQGKSEGKLTKNLKAAMVLNNVNEADMERLGLSSEYKPKTAGAKPEKEGGSKDTLYHKAPVEKLPMGSEEFNRLTKKYGMTPEQLQALQASGVSQREIEKAILKDKKFRSKPVTFGSETDINQGNHNNLKWHPTAKNYSIISKETIEEDGKKLFKLTKVGKEQLEFLQRMLSDRPLPKNGDPNVDIEAELLNTKWPYRNVVFPNAEHIIRDFFGKALVPIIAATLKRNKNSPADSQFVTLLESGINHAIDQTKSGKYNQEAFNNYGAWFMQIVKNKVIDQLKSLTNYVLDTKELHSRLAHQSTPLSIDSKVPPQKAFEGNYEVTESPFEFIDNGIKKHYYRYTFNDPVDAASLFGRSTEGKGNNVKVSPFNHDYIRNPNEFYKSISKNKPEEFTKTTYEPGEGSASERAMYDGVSYEDMVSVAKTEVDNILDEIATEISSPVSFEKGEKIQVGNIGKFQKTYPARAEEMTHIDPKKQYEIVEKTPGKKKGTVVYYIIDDTGRKIGLPGTEYLKKTQSIDKEKSVLQALSRNYKEAVIETMRLLLQYGQMRPKYKQTVYYKKNGEWIKLNVGQNILLTKEGEIYMPYRHLGGNKYERYQRANDIPIEYVWDSSKIKESGEDVVNKISQVAQEKNIPLPTNLFDETTKEPISKDGARNFVNIIRNGLRKFFGFTSIGSPAIKKDRDLLNDLLKNYQASELSENRVRKAVRKMLSEQLKMNQIKK